MSGNVRKGPKMYSIIADGHDLTDFHIRAMLDFAVEGVQFIQSIASEDGELLASINVTRVISQG
jgi:hypothetical protein